MRDSNPDNVFQRASDGLWSASVRDGFRPILAKSICSASVRFAVFLRNVSHRVSPDSSIRGVRLRPSAIRSLFRRHIRARPAAKRLHLTISTLPLPRRGDSVIPSVVARRHSTLAQEIAVELACLLVTSPGRATWETDCGT